MTGTFNLQFVDSEDDESHVIGAKTINPKAGSPMNFSPNQQKEERKALSTHKPPRSDEKKAKTAKARNTSPLKGMVDEMK
jgi:hypothetical protein